MIDRTEISEAMIEAAMRAAAPFPLTHDDARRILSAGLSKLNIGERSAPYPLWVSTSIDMKRARFLGVTERRCYYRVQSEDGKELVVHSNEIEPGQG